MDFLILHLRGECFVRTWPESAVRTWPDPYSCRAAVRCPEASSSPRAKVALNSGRRSAPSASLLDKAVGSNVPAETLREPGSRQQRPVLAYSSQVRRTFLHTYMLPTPHLTTCVPYTYCTYYTYTLYWQKERALDFELFSYNVIILMYMQSHNLYAVDKYSFSATHHHL